MCKLTASKNEPTTLEKIATPRKKPSLLLTAGSIVTSLASESAQEFLVILESSHTYHRTTKRRE